LNFDEINVQVGKQFGTKILTKRGSNEVYSTIPKSWEQLYINIAMNVIKVVLLEFYIFRGETL
jgi:hypothetical protein